MTRTETATITENVQHSDKHDLQQQHVDNDDVTKDHVSEANCRIHEKEANSQLWVWSHPASFNSVFDAITEACNSVGKTSVEKDSQSPDAVEKDGIANPEQLDQGTQSIPLVNGIDRSELKVISHRFDLLRLRLAGPQSHALLASTLKLSTGSKPKDSEDNNCDNNTSHKESPTFCNDKGINSSSLKWWKTSLDSPSDSLVQSTQSALWDKLKKACSPSVLPPGCVIGLTVDDPRLYLPVKKTSIASATEGINSGNAVV